jgi:hypothetical protein
MVKFALDGGTVDESSGEFDNRKAAYTQLRLKVTNYWTVDY